MEERDWVIIKELYKQKNITKTAQALFISQPGLTGRIQHIENEFGARLIYRASRGIHFTSEGDFIAQSADDMIASIRRIKEQISNMKSEVNGTLRLAASTYLAQFILPKMLGRFKEKFPHVEFNVMHGLSRDMCGLLNNQEVHVGFVCTDYGWRGEKHLLYEEQVCVAAKKKIDLDDLLHLPRIDYRKDYAYNNLLDNWWGENFAKPPIIGMTVSQLAISKAMIINGLGYAILPSAILKDSDDLHKIYLYDKNGDPILRKTYMFYPKEMLEIKMVRLFVEFARQTDFEKLI